MNPVSVPHSIVPEPAVVPKVSVGAMLSYLFVGGALLLLLSSTGSVLVSTLLYLIVGLQNDPDDFMDFISIGFVGFFFIGVLPLWRWVRLMALADAAQRLVLRAIMPMKPFSWHMAVVPDDIKIRYFDLCVMGDALYTERWELIELTRDVSVSVFSVGLETVNRPLRLLEQRLCDTGFRMRVQQHNTAVEWMNEAIGPSS